MLPASFMELLLLVKAGPNLHITVCSPQYHHVMCKPIDVSGTPSVNAAVLSELKRPRGRKDQ